MRTMSEVWVIGLFRRQKACVMHGCFLLPFEAKTKMKISRGVITVSWLTVHPKAAANGPVPVFRPIGIGKSTSPEMLTAIICSMMKEVLRS
jgi:hypothetical protein